jgi:hypothetical protein
MFAIQAVNLIINFVFNDNILFNIYYILAFTKLIKFYNIKDIEFLY